ncbi:MAG: DUF2785 domain-containing protein [Bacillota bacterium]|jgi:hypothetical protein
MNEFQLKLKQRLQELKAADFAPFKDQKPLLPLCLEMAPFIGSPDPVLRDELILDAFYVIINDDLLSPDELRQLLDIIIDDQHLLCGLGESDTDTVYARTFSMLITGLLIEADCRQHFMDENTVLALKDLLIRQISMEQDLRGHTGAKGWAHSVAHSADTINCLIKHPLISADPQYIREILHVILQKICTHKMTYIFNEDERTVAPVLTALENGHCAELVTGELAMMVEAVRAAKNQLTLAEHWVMRTNVKNFLNSLYAHLHLRECASAHPHPHACTHSDPHACSHAYTYVQEFVSGLLLDLAKRDTKMISFVSGGI